MKKFLEIENGEVSSQGVSMKKIVFSFLSLKIKMIWKYKDFFLFFILISFLFYFFIENFSIKNKVEEIGVISATIFFIFLYWFMHKDKEKKGGKN